MGDSDDEYDRRRGRDKFRKERSDYQERRDDRTRRDDWSDRNRESWAGNRDNRNSGGRRDYRDYGNRRDRYSPSNSPPMKHVRRDWEDRGGYGGGMMTGAHHGNWNHDGGMGHAGQFRDDQNVLTQPPMMTFKQFLSSQDDSIDDQEAVKKYSDYKVDFIRDQLNQFFLNHKEEEWFKCKYHPEESTRRKSHQLAALKRRLDVFLELVDPSRELMITVSLDVDKSEDIVKLLDSVVIKLEGGTDFDLKCLDMPIEEPKIEIAPPPPPPPPTQPPVAEVKEDGEESKIEDPEPAPENGGGGGKKRKRGRGYDSDEDSGSDSESEESENEDNKSNDKEAKKVQNKEVDQVMKDDDDDDGPSKDNEVEEDVDKVVDSKVEDENDKKDNDGENDELKRDDAVQKEEVKDEEPKPRPLHRTCSIFLRNLAPTITKQEVEAMCKRYPGFLRAAIADPTAERRFFRRGWVTFERTVNIKEICWNLNNIRLRECELGAIVNRDLSRRIRSVSGIAAHRQIVRADIKLATKIIQNLDDKQQIWKDDNVDSPVVNTMKLTYGMVSKNPLLKNITDYLIEEASAEEEELLGTAEQDNEEKESESTLERDESLIKVLDKLILYLRIVHSVDYYNCSEYPAEDEMPNRCGIIHARGAPPSSKVTPNEVNDYIQHFEQKVGPFLIPYSKLTDEESEKLGKKNCDVELENFIKANAQELAKDKWLCPLSGKKFKGPEFVRKHIFNKHAEKVDEVKREVEYFNNYLMDPRRPQLPEHPGNMRGPHGGYGGFGQGGGYHQNQTGFNRYQGRNNYDSSRYTYRRGFSNPRGNRRSTDNHHNMLRHDPREIVGYQDLDAPQDVDIF